VRNGFSRETVTEIMLEAKVIGFVVGKKEIWEELFRK
jgi:hypothetical protein